MDLRNKTIVLTGGSSGIGLALARALAKKGCNVYSFDVKEPEEPLEGVKSLRIDITDSKQVQEGLKKIDSPIDILINNAGVMRRGTIFDSTEEEYDLLFDVAVKGSWLMLKHAKPSLAPNAMIVQMASRYARRPAIDPGLYTLTKQTVMHLAELVQSTCPEYTVKFLIPGPTDTDISRHGVTDKTLEEKIKIMQSSDYVAEKIVELLESDDKIKLIYKKEKREYVME